MKFDTHTEKDSKQPYILHYYYKTLTNPLAQNLSIWMQNVCRKWKLNFGENFKNPIFYPALFLFYWTRGKICLFSYLILKKKTTYSEGFWAKDNKPAGQKVEYEHKATNWTEI